VPSIEKKVTSTHYKNANTGFNSSGNGIPASSGVTTSNEYNTYLQDNNNMFSHYVKSRPIVTTMLDD
jgi:hypothetical protein